MNLFISPIASSVASVRVSVRALWRFILRTMMFAAAAALPFKAAAFKVETHVWIAQQVINDLAKDPALPLSIGPSRLMAPVPKAVRDAILANQEAFRMGSVGPDAFPGVYEGQMTIHPGAAGNNNVGWGTADWLAHLLRAAQTPEEIAFAYGFLTHAAADIFAHTYINQYAGDVYYLTDGEIDVETRHFLMEGYIAERMPALVGVDGRPITSISGSLLKSGQLAVPAGFLWRAFVDNATASQQFKANGASHISSIYDLSRSLTNLSRKDGPLEKLHELSQQIMSYWYTGQTIDAGLLKRLNELHEQFNAATNKEIDRLQDTHNQFVAFSKTVLGAAHQQERDALNRAQSILSELNKARQRLNKIESEVADAIDAEKKLVDDVKTEMVKKCEKVAAAACTRVGHPLGCGGSGWFSIPCAGYTDVPTGCGVVSEVCKMVESTITVVNSLRPSAKQLIQTKQALESQAVNELTRLFDDYKATMESVYNAEKALINTHQAIFNASVDLIQRTRLAADPVTSLARAWTADINKSMSEYFVANAATMANAMDGGDVLKPLHDWVECSAPALLGLQSPVLDVKCSVKSSIKELNEAMDALLKLAAYSDPVLQGVRRIKEQLDKAIAIAQRDVLTSFATKVTGVEVKRLLELIKSKPSKAVLDAQFMQASTKKALIVFDKVSDRLDAEMHLDANGKYSPEKFHPIYNAVVLAKLAMLDASALNTVVGKIGRAHV